MERSCDALRVLRYCLAFLPRYATHQPPNTRPLSPTRLYLAQFVIQRDKQQQPNNHANVRSTNQRRDKATKPTPRSRCPQSNAPQNSPINHANKPSLPYAPSAFGLFLPHIPRQSLSERNLVMVDTCRVAKTFETTRFDTKAPRASRSLGTGRMGTSGFLKSASIMWAHAPTTRARPACCSAIQREPQVGIRTCIYTLETTR
jgi:hypothetical protein